MVSESPKPGLRCRIAAVLAVLVLITAPVEAGNKRSSAARSEFKRSQPCPSTGNRSGPCPGWTIDHVQPLACGGADSPYNMQWQTTEAAKAKDRWERDSCRR